MAVKVPQFELADMVTRKMICSSSYQLLQLFSVMPKSANNKCSDLIIIFFCKRIAEKQAEHGRNPNSPKV